MRRLLIITASAVGALALASPAYATIVFCDGAANTCGNGGQGDTVHLDGLDTGSDNIVNGTVDGAGVIITGLENITVSANGGGQGQAWVVGVDGGLTSLDFALQTGDAFNLLEFQLNPPNGGGPPQQWSVVLSGFDASHTEFTQTFSGITNNQFFNINAINGEVITHASFVTNTDLLGVGQIRIGGVTAIPEPATWALMILGVGGAGAMLRRRKVAIA